MKGQDCHLFAIFFRLSGVCVLFSLHFFQLLPCMMGHEAVVRGNVQVNTAVADCKSCSKQNKLLLCSILKKRQVDCFERRRNWWYFKKCVISYLPCSFKSTGYEEAYDVFNFSIFCTRVLSSSASFLTQWKRQKASWFPLLAFAEKTCEMKCNSVMNGIL